MKWMIFGVASTLVVALVYVLGVYMPTANRMGALSRQKEALLATRDKRQALADNIDRVLEHLDRLDEDSARALQKLPDEVPALADHVSVLAESAGVAVRTTETLDAPTQLPLHESQRWVVVVTGATDNLASFLQEIDQAELIIHVEQLTLTPDQLRVELDTYRLTPQR